MFAGCCQLESASLPSATSIGNWSFYICYFLTDIYIPKVVYIYSQAFEYAYRLKTLDLPSLEDAEGPFIKSCFNLRNISMPKLRRIPDSLFYNFRQLYIPYMPNVEIIGKHAFENCVLLENIFENLKIKQIDDYAFANMQIRGYEISFKYCEHVGNYAFDGSTIMNISLPNLRSCGDYSFSHLNVQNLYFPLIEKCGYFSFSFNSNLVNVTLPLISQMGDGPFEGCTKLHIVNLPNLTEVNNYFISHIDMKISNF